MLATTLKFLSIGWVGGALLVGLLLNGEQLYSWVGYKNKSEQDEMRRLLDLMFVNITPGRLNLFYFLYLCGLFSLAILFFAPSMGPIMFFGGFFVFLGWTLPRRMLRMMHKKRIKKSTNQLQL
jgi:Flp pilus assembly protein TadB